MSDSATWVVRAGDPAAPADAAALAALRLLWRPAPSAAAARAFAVSLGGWWRDHAASHLAFLGELDGTAIAMAWLAVVDRVPSADQPRRLGGYLQSVFVTEEHRNAGRGADVVAKALDTAASRGLEYVAVHPSQRSFSFYERLGFAETPRVRELDLRAAPTQ